MREVDYNQARVKVDGSSTKLTVGGIGLNADFTTGVAIVTRISPGLHRIPDMITLLSDALFSDTDRYSGTHPDYKSYDTNEYDIPKYVSTCSECGRLIMFTEHEIDSPHATTLKVYIPNTIASKVVEDSDLCRRFIMPIADTVILEDESYRPVLNSICNKEILPNSNFTCNDVPKSYWSNGSVRMDGLYVRLDAIRYACVGHLYDQYGLPALVDWVSGQNYLSVHSVRRMLEQMGILTKRSDFYPEPTNDVKPEWIRATQAIQVFDRIFCDMKYPFRMYSGDIYSGKEAYDAKFCSMVENITGKHVDDILQGEIEFKSWLNVDVFQYKNPTSETFKFIFNAATNYVNGLISEGEFTLIQNEQAEHLPVQFDRDIVLDSIWKYANRYPNRGSEYKLDDYLLRRIMHDVLWNFAQNN